VAAAVAVTGRLLRWQGGVMYVYDLGPVDRGLFLEAFLRFGLPAGGEADSLQKALMRREILPQERDNLVALHAQFMQVRRVGW
jgi:hypothetical protein